MHTYIMCISRPVLLSTNIVWTLLEVCDIDAPTVCDDNLISYCPETLSQALCGIQNLACLLVDGSNLCRSTFGIS